MLLLAVALYGAVIAQAQTGTCGTFPNEQIKERLLANRENSRSGTAVSDRGAIQYVPVYFHLVGDAQGNGKVKEAKVLDQLCALNTAYASMDIRFYLSPHPTTGALFNYSINNTNVYSNQNAWATMHSNRHQKAVNIFIVDDAGSNGNSITLGYYNSQRDWLVIRRDQVSGSTSNAVVPHEAGHFFSLMHTFNGWESNPFDSADPTWPVAPILSPDGTPTEKMNGSNWATAGDFLQDTPPDYNFGLGYSGCNYTDGAKDPTGQIVNPMENNMMGYFLDCTTHEFTENQKAMILADLGSNNRNYLDNTFIPAATAITTPTNFLVAPANGEVVPYYNSVNLEWNAVPGATFYLLEVDFLSANSKSYIVNTTSKVLTDLEANKLYLWRVRPFNEYVTCANTQQRQFRTPTTATAIRDIEGLDDWQIAPNPLQTDAPATLLVHANSGFTANIRVFDVAGRTVFEQTGMLFSEGSNTVELPVTGAQNGLYFVVMQNKDGQNVRKLSIAR